MQEKDEKTIIDKQLVATSQRYITQETVMLEKLMSISSSNFKADAVEVEPSAQNYDTMCLDKYQNLSRTSSYSVFDANPSASQYKKVEFWDNRYKAN